MGVSMPIALKIGGYILLDIGVAETYILDFEKNIYDRWISVSLIKKIRNNKKFPSAKGLIIQMKKDESEAKKYFEYHGVSRKL
ncbi:hypothetical protein A2617_01725 [Candidatus Daviesbacteria bacterium RIFOXYD1_FULL_41_10]|uniref:riboflavin kinase n=1 Tax=Candidatus Daviesbacteria bacterium RIFOXYD1_FULL_41_10 TaxID=1797801 RepID=A0A1F5MZJ6_9BACT|nr:MAG: hypothetical protein A2617_01725 [Candidatus Daviesbacteria bacterium RIFOXYD1_FULL_41_10]